MEMLKWRVVGNGIFHILNKKLLRIISINLITIDCYKGLIDQYMLTDLSKSVDRL